jgi:hypothetical protein
MYRKLLIAIGVTAAIGSGVVSSGAGVVGPGPGVTGNDTGGIFPYSPAVEGIYKDIAEHHCARYGRLAQVTSVHRMYGDYVSFVCYDHPGMIH